MQKSNATDDKWYIAPLCKAHSKISDAEFSIYNTWPLIEITGDEACCKIKTGNSKLISI